tara:strand:+ start:317 stop:1030 length:714 start_codon:yes stop_codon:yes gene_type:complete
MKAGKKIEIETLNLKLLSECLEEAETNLKDGNDDLHFRLSHFRKRVANKDLDRFDEYFFGAKMKDIEKKENELSTVLPQQEKDIVVIRPKIDAWLKKIYRKIVSSTHPDKFENFPIENLKEKYLKIYRKTVTAWDAGEKDVILISAYEADIEVNHPEALIILQQGNKQKNNRLKTIKKLLAYQWHHILPKDKSKTLEVYLAKLGYKFTSKEVEKVVNLARKRKTGTRPKNFRKLIKT